MTGDALQIVLLLVASVAMGGAIGIERNYHGHAAGFRTYGLVCLTSCALMLLAVHPSVWMGAASPDVLRLNITRVIQGVMTGIGFLGAGVIMKEGLEVRGLTTAAAIWSTAAIGILVGVGSLWTALAATVLTLGVLTAFRALESKVPIELIVHAELRFARGQHIPEDELRALVSGFAFTITELSYALDAQELFVYRLVLKTRSSNALSQLAETLRRDPRVRRFDIALRRD